MVLKTLKQYSSWIFLLLWATALVAADYDLDNSFGGGDGMVAYDFGDFDQSLQYIVVLPDGSIVAGGYQTSPNMDVLLVKYDSQGNPVAGFGTNGHAVFDYDGSGDALQDLVVLPSGLILALVRKSGVDNDYLLARFTSTGTPDLNFGTSGKEILDFANTDDSPSAIGIQSTGKIVIAGSVEFGAGARIGLVRYNENGGIDNTFGTSGKTTSGFSGLPEYGLAMQILGDDKILVAGHTTKAGNNNDFFLARYTADGLPDMTFGDNGYTTVDFAGDDDYVRAIALQGTMIVLGGQVDGPGDSDDLGLARFDADGDPDPNFGVGGKVITSFGGTLFLPDEEIQDIVIQDDLKIVIVGTVDNSLTPDNLLVGRYTQNGTPDSTFNTSGFVSLDVSGHYDLGNGVALQADGKILVAGSTATASERDGLIVRFGGDGGGGGGNPVNCTGAVFCDQFDSIIFDPYWDYAKPSWDEISGKLTGAPSGKKAVALAESGWVNGNQVTIQTTMQTSGGDGNSIWLLGWYADNKNYVELVMKEETDKWILKHHSNGVVVAKGKGSKPIAPNQVYTVKMAYDGSHLLVYIDDMAAPLISMTVTAALQPGTVGYQVKGATAAFEYIRVDE